MIKMLHEKGIKSEHAYMAGFASIGMAVASWCASLNIEAKSVARADRWGIFIGEWAPTFFGIGLALANYERDEKHERMQSELDQMLAGHS
jgi:hypothetical protein